MALLWHVTMQTALNDLLRISVKHTYLRGNTFYFRRPVPRDLQTRVGRTTIKKNLHTSDPIQAAQLVAKIKAELESEWATLRGQLSATGSMNGEFPHVAAAESSPGVVCPESVSAHSPKQGQISSKSQRDTVTSALEFYFKTHEKGGSSAFQRVPQIAVDQFVEIVGDKQVEEVSRADVHRWMERSVLKGQSKGTIERRLKCLKAIFSMFIRERELEIPNRFEKHIIPGAAKKAVKRDTLSPETLRNIQVACKTMDDDVRWATAILSDTCSRLAEVIGLRLSDIVLDTPVPYVSIEEHDARCLKTANSKRVVPLVGVALWGAQRLKASAVPGQIYAFPRYVKDRTCNNLSASATINKWLRSMGAEHTTHELRHTMADRLRDVGCPKEIRDQIGGWARTDMSANYGQGYSLETMKTWLDMVVLDDKYNLQELTRGEVELMV